MPNWGEVLNEIQQKVQAGDMNAPNTVRNGYLSKLAAYTKRNTIIYCTRWTQMDGLNIPNTFISITPEDVQGLMAVMPGLQGDKLDLIVHSPGGSAEATKAIVDYLRTKFKHVRVIVPLMAMSAATMLACSADEIVMGKHSFLGPIDPQMLIQTASGQRPVTAQNVTAQFKMIADNVAAGANIAPYVPMLSQYGPDMLVLCKNASELSARLVEEWLAKYRFKGTKAGAKKAKDIAEWLSTHNNFKSHGVFISREELDKKGLNITPLEGDQMLQELVLSTFHACTHTFGMTGIVKLIENQNGLAFVKNIMTPQMMQAPMQPAQPVRPQQPVPTLPIPVPPNPPAP